MAEIRETAAFGKWLAGLRDPKGKAKILVRIQRMAAGNPGNVGPVGDGVSEMRIDFGPGYRVYYRQRGEVTTLLCGGDKDTQQGDIRAAKALAQETED